MNSKKFIIHTDGGARNNPGPAGIGCTLTPQPPLPQGEGKRIPQYCGTSGVRSS